MPNRHVVSDGKGGWIVKVAGVDKPTSHHRTQSNAEDRARRDLKKDGGGELITHRPTGPIRSKDTIARRDPNPPRDKEH